MSRIRTTSTAVALLLTAGIPAGMATAKQPPKPPKPVAGQLTLAAAPNPINFGGSTTLTGKLAGGQAGGQTVVVEANPAPFTAFRQIATVTTNANGTYAATVKPGVITRYRVTAKTAPPTVSGEVAVGVRIRVGLILGDATPRRGTRVVFSGRAYPAHDGALVSIRKRSSTGSYVTIARTRLLDDGSARSRYSRAVRIARSGVYQVRVSNNGPADHLAGISRARRITVH
ncbi:MAG: hypothetical protein QOE11_1870 [Solirubrobacteraceae bacterium]|nr:hypothetical protein [Solirubrobacteraceae bacterium]